jgi:hypothetical protein
MEVITQNWLDLQQYSSLKKYIAEVITPKKCWYGFAYRGPKKIDRIRLDSRNVGFPLGNLWKIKQIWINYVYYVFIYIYSYLSLYVCVLYITTKQVFGIVTPTDHHLFAKPGSPGPSQRARTAEAAGRVVGTSLRAPGTPIPRSTGLLAHPPTPKSLISWTWLNHAKI